MSKANWILGVVITLSATSCMVGPDYERPGDLPVPDDFRAQKAADSAVQTEQDAQRTFGDLAWSEAFGDPVLQELIETALENNQDLAIAAERVMQARSFVTITAADRLPDVNAEGSYQVSKSTKNGTIPLPSGFGSTTEQWLVGANLSWELDFWGRFARASEAARADMMATHYARQAIMQSLVAELASSYFDLLLLDAQLHISQETLDSRQSSLDLVSLRLDQGVANKVEYYQAQGLVLETASVLPALEQAIQQRENAIRFLIGAGPGPVTRGLPLREQSFAIDVPIGLPSNLLQRRPDVSQAEQGLVAANARIGEAKALLYPSIGLTVFGGLASEDLSDLTSSGSDTWGITPSVYLPIFNGGRLRSNIDVTESQKREAALRYTQTLQTAFREVADALIRRQKRAEVRDWQSQRESSAQSQVELSRDRYLGGVTSYLEVLESERGHFDSEISLTASIRDELLSYVQLYRALGGGWQGPEAAAFEAEGEPTQEGL
ncbi:MAG: multidrug efflux system outer membrane protein [Planctomycetota bacterium]|jgi:multidrug efflux system outer membrane protein